MTIEVPGAPREDARQITETFFKLRAEAKKKASKDQVASGCAICSAYEALGRRGWLKKKAESDYKNHLFARHGLEP